MPVPVPNADESETDYMSRCMKASDMSKYPEDQRMAMCLSSYSSKDTEELDEDFLEPYEQTYLAVKADLMATSDATGGFTGYGAVFGNVDRGGDKILKGAFANSIIQKGAKGIKCLFQHKIDEPIGIYTEIAEDANGLIVKGQLAMGTQRGKETYELMKMGAIDGLSIGYRVNPKGYTYEENGKVRVLSDLDLMEISAVTFPMNPKATISAVKAANKTIREWENFLRDAGSLSHSESKAAAKAVVKALNLRDADEDKPELLGAIKHLTDIIRSNRSIT